VRVGETVSRGVWVVDIGILFNVWEVHLLTAQGGNLKRKGQENILALLVNYLCLFRVLGSLALLIFDWSIADDD